MPRICLLVGRNGSLTPSEAVAAARESAEPVLLIDRVEAAGLPGLVEVATGLAETHVVDTSDPRSVSALVDKCGAAAVATFVDAYCPLVDDVTGLLFGRTGAPNRWGKDTQRELLAAAGVSAITGCVASTLAELAAAVRRCGFPLVAKPVRGVSSRDAWLLRTPTDQARFVAAVSFGSAEAFVVEPYIDGPSDHTRGSHRADYLSAELFVGGGELSGFLTDRPPLAEPLRETGIIGPSTVDGATEQAVWRTAHAAHRALGLGSGAFHIEIKLTDGDPEVIEVNGRLGGYVRRVAQLGTGADVGVAAIRAALDRPPGLELRWQRQVAAMLLQPPVGAVVAAGVPRRQDLRLLPGVISVEQVVPAGTRCDWRAGTSAAAATLWLAAPNDQELAVAMCECAAWLVDAFDFHDANGRPVRDDGWVDRLSASTGAPSGKGASW